MAGEPGYGWRKAVQVGLYRCNKTLGQHHQFVHNKLAVVLLFCAIFIGSRITKTLLTFFGWKPDHSLLKCKKRGEILNGPVNRLKSSLFFLYIRLLYLRK